MTTLNLMTKLTVAGLMFLVSVSAAFAPNVGSEPASYAGPAVTATTTITRFAQSPPPSSASARPLPHGYSYALSQTCIPAELYRNPAFAPLMRTQQNSPDLAQGNAAVQQHDEELVRVMPRVGEE